MTITMPDPATTRHLAYAESIINAPPEAIWQALTHFPAYDEWNPFAYNVRMPECEVGKTFQFTVQMGNSARDFTERIHIVEPHHTLAWGFAHQSFLLRAIRYQILIPISDNKTRYQTWEQFGGLLAPVISLTVLESVHYGFEQVATALKNHVESTYTN
ncbi:MAG: SRPBCC domain-containing protein [Chloroflexota bacterium]